MSVQLHPPLPLSVHVADDQPKAEKIFCALSHVTGTDEIDMHEGANGNETEPFVIVLSVNIASAPMINVPVVWKDPVAGTVAQPKLDNETSMSPDIFRQEDTTFQVPTTSPAQGFTLEQDVAPPALLPPEPELPPEPLGEVPSDPEHPTKTTAETRRMCALDLMFMSAPECGGTYLNAARQRNGSPRPARMHARSEPQWHLATQPVDGASR